MKTTKAHFASFKKFCRQYLDLFGLRDWEAFISHTKDEDNRASCTVNGTDHRMVNLNLAKDWDADWGLKITDEEIRKCALHEVLELRMWEIRKMLRVFYSEEVVDEQIHKIIRTLENIIP